MNPIVYIVAVTISGIGLLTAIWMICELIGVAFRSLIWSLEWVEETVRAYYVKRKGNSA